MKATYKNCQSCGMPLKHDPKKGGTEKDGTKSRQYCSYCYEKGKFLSPAIDTPQKMQQFCMEKMREKGMNRFVAWLFTRSIPRLARWRKNNL